jgi:hypothetical protein
MLETARLPKPAWAGKCCGDCFYWRLHREYPYGEYEDGGKCRNPERPRKSWSGMALSDRIVHLRTDPACMGFLSPWRRDFLMLEQLGQKCIQFVTCRGGATLIAAPWHG